MSTEKGRMPGEPEGVIRRLRDERPQLGALELENMKLRLMNRVGPQMRGAALRGRVAIGVLSLSLMGAGAGGVLAGSGGSGNGSSAAAAQYKPRCHHGQHFDKKKHKCVKGHSRPGNGHRGHKKPKSHTGGVTDVTTTAATLHGFVHDPPRTGYYFQYGACPALTKKTPTRHTTSSRSVSARIRGLKLGTKYCYRLVSFNKNGKSVGATRSFRTSTSGAANNGRGFTG